MNPWTRYVNFVLRSTRTIGVNLFALFITVAIIWVLYCAWLVVRGN